MLEFICDLENLLNRWPSDAHWTLAQIADEANASIPLVVEVMCGALNRELEVHEAISLKDATEAVRALKERMRVQLAARQRRLDAQKEQAILAYDQAMGKVRILQMGKQWRAAYKTISYFVGVHEKNLPNDLILTLCGDCLRLGIKANENLQELSRWLRKGVNACVQARNPAAIEDALDFIDAYSDHFAEEPAGAGRRLLGNVLTGLKTESQAQPVVVQIDAMVRDLSSTLPAAS